MAKKNKVKEPKDKGSIIATIILIILMIIIILAAFALFVRFDVAGFGSKVMRPLIKDTPVINMILPNEKKETSNKNSPYKTLDEAVLDVQKLQAQIDKLKRENADNKSKVEDLTKENAKLKEVEKHQDEVENRIKEYENEVVFGESAPDITEYQKYYEQIDPERAEELYKQVIYKVSADEKAKELSKTYSKMDPGAAAAAMEELDDNIALVCDVLLDMSEKNRAVIMNEMSAAFAAKVTKRIYAETK